jgi:hypothetical protein
VNFCKAHNKSLVSLADLGITDRTVDWLDLRDKIGTNWYWTTDAASCDFNTWACTSGTNNNSCSAFNVNLSSGAVFDYYARYNSNAYALCE